MTSQAEKDLANIYKLLITPSGARAAIPHFQSDFDKVRKITEPYYRASLKGGENEPSSKD